MCAIFEYGLDLTAFDLILLLPYVFSGKFRIVEYFQICGMFEDGFDFFTGAAIDLGHLTEFIS